MKRRKWPDEIKPHPIHFEGNGGSKTAYGRALFERHRVLDLVNRLNRDARRATNFASIQIARDVMIRWAAWSRFRFCFRTSSQEANVQFEHCSTFFQVALFL
jgi:hypothetical protein